MLFHMSWVPKTLLTSGARRGSRTDMRRKKNMEEREKFIPTNLSAPRSLWPKPWDNE